MDVAAQEITKLVQCILPERPHHLSVSATIRYPVPSGLWPNTSPLQYTTYVSEADRGVLLTRPYFDIQLEPDETTKTKPNGSNNRSRPLSSADVASTGGTPTAANSKGEAKKPITKMSFKDYQQSKQQKKLPGSPPDTLGVSRLDAKPSKGAEAMSSVERQRLPPKPDSNGDRKFHSPSKSPRPAHSPNAVDNRKRVAETNDSASRPHKRSRSDTSMSSSSPPAASASKFSHRIHDPPSPLDLNNRRDDRTRQTANGLFSQSKQRDKYRDRDGDRDRERDRDRDRDRNHDRDRERDRDRDRARFRDREKDRTDTHRRSPPSPSVSKTNGHEYHRDHERDRSRERSLDDDTGPLSALPPILSPLHFNPERSSDSTAKRPRPSTEPAATSSKGSGKAESRKKEDFPFRIPPLLSPTLPAIVEQELSRLKKTPVNEYESKPKASQEPTYTATAGKKPSRPNADIDMEDVAYKEAPLKDSRKEKGEPQKETSAQPSSKRSLVVVLKYKKKNAKRVHRLLALQPTPLKGPPKYAERSVSIEDTPSPAQPITKKRPAPSDIPTNELLPPPSATSSSFKHPKTFAEKSVSASRTSVGPGTPIKSTPMARGTSNNSLVLTPGDSTSYTPRSSERPPTSQGDLASNMTVTDYRRRYDTYLKLGTKLKHDRDAIVKSRMPNGTAKADGASVPALVLTLSEKKLVAALSLEMVMSYLIAFKSLNQGRHLERKPGDVTVWERLMPHFAELRSHARHFRPLEALTVQLRAICFEQMLASFVGHEAETVAAKLMVATKQRIDAWTEVANCVDAVNDSSLKVVVGPWHSIEDTVRIMLPTMRRWNERENAGWEQELQPPK